jgi:general secretion pathway protein L
MRRQLVIRLPDSDEHDSDSAVHASWLLRDAERPAGSLFHGELKEAAVQAAGARVAVLVPGTEVLLAQVELPAMNRSRLARAVPFVLEEQLADDVENLHVAVGERDVAGRVANAVVARDTLDAWLARLRAVGLQADVVSPELFGVPRDDTSDGWTLLIDESRALLRTGPQTGLGFDPGSLVPVLNACLDGAGETLPERLEVTVCADDSFENSPVYRDLAELCAEQEVELSLYLADEAGDVMLAQSFDEQTAINLLQGDYSRKEQLEKLLRPWRPALILAGLWLVLQFGLLGVEYTRFSTQHSELNEQITTLYRETFPEARKIVDPKVQMEQALQKLRGGDGDRSGLLPLLNNAGAVLNDTPGLQLRSLRYSNGKLDVDLRLPDLQALDGLKQTLSGPAGLTVEIVSASSRDGKVESRIALSGGGK